MHKGPGVLRGRGRRVGVPRQLTPPRREIQSYRSREKKSEKEKQD